MGFSEDIKDAFNGHNIGWMMKDSQFTPEQEEAIRREVERRSPKPPQTTKEKLAAFGKYLFGLGLITSAFILTVGAVRLCVWVIASLF